MPPRPKVKVDDKRLERKLARARKHALDMRPAFNEIGEILLSSIEENFQQEGRYSSPDSVMGGNRTWDELAEPTKEQRAKKGKWPGKILQVKGKLAASINKQVTHWGVTIGTNKIQAALLQHGGKAGRGHKVTVPARPFIVVQDEDLDDANDVLTKHLLRGLKRD